MRTQTGNVFSGTLIILLLAIIGGGLFFLITKSNNPETKQTEQINYIDDTPTNNTIIDDTDKQNVTSDNSDTADTENNTDNLDYGYIDGLKNPVQTQTFDFEPFEDGISSIETFEYDINNDGLLDKITRSYYFNWTAHSYYQYKIEINQNNKYIDVTPKNFRTEEAADCPLQKIKFIFKPSFSVVMVSRPSGETLIDPTKAKKIIYKLSDNKFVQDGKEQDMGIICDVTDLLK